ncbi:MAG TPA: nucleoside deaminase [Anaerolineales bacterium]|nr:nucleoside deaminase [Anaerolineales bacterium]
MNPIVISVPDWLAEETAKLPQLMPSIEERMSHVIRFSRLNFERGTGGPFAAGLFEKESGKLVMMGVNRVVPTHVSSAHAEVVTLSLAQQALGTFDLGGEGMPEMELVVNWRPCAMCYGAMLWSGVRSLVIAGSGPECEEITGFDEGPIHPDWVGEAQKRGVTVREGVLNAEAVQVFRDFAASGALVYNGRGGSS